MSLKRNLWLAPGEVVLPDFIIAGAMKSGTTTLHDLLNSHPDVYIPRGELHFFDFDDVTEHGDFNYYQKDSASWISLDIEESTEYLWKWYSDHFKDHQSKYLGEDSTTYLSSQFAPERISIQNKDIKVIVILRQPSLRAFSQYMHMLNSGRAVFSFEETIRRFPDQIIKRSQYLNQLKRLFKYISRERVKVLVFEELQSNPRKILKELCQFLKLDFDKIPVDAFNIHSNRGKLRKSQNIQLLYNRFFPPDLRGGLMHFNLNNQHIKCHPNPRTRFYAGKIHNVINPYINKGTQIKPKTKKFLDKFFMRDLKGIDDLLENKVYKNWFPE